MGTRIDGEADDALLPGEVDPAVLSEGRREARVDAVPAQRRYQAETI
jgi:hypothetical protein